MDQNNRMHLNNGSFAYDGVFRYSGVSLYFLQKEKKSFWATGFIFGINPKLSGSTRATVTRFDFKNFDNSKAFT